MPLSDNLFQNGGRMQVFLAEHSGFCFGVRRAVKMALAAHNSNDDVCTYGELIHNPQIVQKLEEEGISVCKDIEHIKGKKVVIRSHGIAREDLELLQAAGNEIIDATCPYVKRAQELVSSVKDLPLLIMGDPDHPEVQALLSYGGKQTKIIQPGEKPEFQNWETLCIVSQTTQKLSNLQELVAQVLPHALELRVFNTICNATTQRQEAALQLAKNSDLMIVIGGKHSANTRVLQELCQQVTRSFHIETAAELTPELLNDAQVIGLAAGASTPEEIIVEVYNQIFRIKGEPHSVQQIEEIPVYKEESC